MNNPHQYVKCVKCGWIHFVVSREKALNEVHEFNKYFNSLSKEQQEKFYGGQGSSLESYEKCMRCGNSHENFVFVIDPKEVPYGSTINPLISPKAGKGME